MLKNGIVAAMEEADNLAAVPADEVEAAEVATTVADDSAVVQAEGSDIGVSVAEIEDAVQGGEELEAVGEVAADAVESGEGLTEDGAQMASIAIESIRNRLGFSRTTKVVPACESFGNTDTRVMSTRIVVEGVSETLTTIWKAIKAAVQRVWDKIKSFFAKLFSSTGMLEKHITGLQDRARKLPNGSKKKENKIKSGIAAKISVGGKANLSTFETVAGNTAKLVAFARAVSESQKTASAAASSLAGSAIDAESVKKFLAVQTTAGSALIRSANFSKVQGGLAGAEQKTKEKAKGKVKNVEAYGPFVGNSVLMVYEIEDTFMGTAYSHGRLAFEQAPGKAAEEVEALDQQGIESVLGEAKKIVLALQDFKKVQDEYDAITKSIVKVADTVMNNAGKILDKTGSSSETRQGLQELKAQVNANISGLNAFGNRAPALMFDLARTAADYASISIRNLTSGGKD